LFYWQNDRLGLMCEALAELLRMRRREDRRQRDHRLERERKVKMRALGVTGARGLTMREIDHDIQERGGMTERAIDDAIRDHGEPIDADARVWLREILDHGHVDVACAAAWWAVLSTVRWTARDWRAGHFALTADGMRKLAWCRFSALRLAIAVLAGYGEHPGRGIDSLWLVMWRTSALGAHELGRVLSAADQVGDDEERAEVLRAALLAVHDHEDMLADRAHKRWEHLHSGGWRNVRPHRSTARAEKQWGSDQEIRSVSGT
jgi:hypothetical protein